jgi:hypothetical protein
MKRKNGLSYRLFGRGLVSRFAPGFQPKMWDMLSLEEEGYNSEPEREQSNEQQTV